MAALTFAPRVADDLREIGDWIAQDNPERAITFIEELTAACQNLMDFPLAYPPIPRFGLTTRRCNHGSYAILYDVADDVVKILAIVHGARDIDVMGF
ncbi:type II toxin-antitoxin system RelE/ParE family toxin [Sphingomonas sp. SUN019]|uniref:type II toxin-antitoxin system RelE/ParE family toxin n=1 Tax=Sphingomonas sp. SUN019 TaxID=2937788 RepID=UPI0021645B8F|nr:type II toxin-antitoxin system RelE/ParE family toxin [Sphingomonas sp. SUN019]UVO50077.1 type II toxin-antitoxin system RelE/ParE family toxin [Sphingomonas sp. SUN019]